jgi:hypothetical protein
MLYCTVTLGRKYGEVIYCILGQNVSALNLVVYIVVQDGSSGRELGAELCDVPRCLTRLQF